MKRSLSLSVVFLSSVVVWAQQTSTGPKTPPASTPSTSSSSSAGQTPAAPASTTQLKPRGPEAVAQRDPNKVVATINGHQLTAQEAMNVLKQIPEDQRHAITNLSNVVEQVYMMDHFAGEAEKRKLDQESPWKERIQLQRTQALAQAYVEELSKAPASGTEAQQYYDGHPADFEQLKLSGILVAFNPPGTPASGGNAIRTEADAQTKANDLEKKIKDGGDFSALARTESDQQQSATRGGDLGTFTINDPKLPPDIRSAVAKLQTGQVTEPIRVPGGFFILKVTSRTKMPFDQARAGIVQKLEVDKYKIQVQDPDFFASSAPASNIPSLQRPAPTTHSSPPPPSAKPQSQ
ncbi:MAG: peptidylprolyl isomerase [Acidobacteriaceae bacterium]|nr:peptidylprolyl isomerase [Acidobacteriaceae bacterium]